ncbi:MAG: polymer-forming cytoskeletal protein [Oscillospiraceae bacterium]|nr:polymer-forming cytoskeletal protein [Oscillospiraceae bacterium]
MGIKENFNQAVRELTGMGKNPGGDKASTSVEGLRRAVEDDSTGSGRPITLDSKPVSDFDLDALNENPVVRPMPRVGSEESQAGIDADSTPAAEAFFANRETPTANPVNPSRTAEQPSAPTSLFGQQPGFSRDGVQPVPQNAGGYGSFQQQSPFMNQGYPSAPASRSSRGEDHELTVISRNTVIDGNIRSFANMSIDGDIKGDVETSKDIDLNGKIVGNVTCNNAMMHTSQVQGNIRMKGNISMKRDTLLIGDLMSTYAEINGKIKGNLDVVGKADLKGDAVVFGDISASTITVEDGAIIQGYVSTTFLNKEESRNLFPDTVVIEETESSRA